MLLNKMQLLLLILCVIIIKIVLGISIVYGDEGNLTPDSITFLIKETLIITLLEQISDESFSKNLNISISDSNFTERKITFLKEFLNTSECLSIISDKTLNIQVIFEKVYEMLHESLISTESPETQTNIDKPSLIIFIRNSILIFAFLTQLSQLISLYKITMIILWYNPEKIYKLVQKILEYL